jgi:hypothetical protein
MLGLEKCPANGLLLVDRASTRSEDDDFSGGPSCRLPTADALLIAAGLVQQHSDQRRVRPVTPYVRCVTFGERSFGASEELAECRWEFTERWDNGGIEPSR